MAHGAGKGILRGLLVLLPLLAGCGEEPAAPQPAVEPPLAGTEFDPATAGTISGQVTWEGELPVVPPFTAWLEPPSENELGHKELRPNPHAPVIEPHSRGVGNAVVFLRGVDPRRARPWDQPPVRIVLDDYRFDVQQGETHGLTGFVRRGDAVEMVSAQAVFHSAHGQGAAFFTLAFPDARQARSRRLQRNGLVELNSGAGYFWMRAYLFVDEHPYYTRTDAGGHFTLDRVPPGPCEVVCWLPHWQTTGHERDPETSLVTRVTFRPPVETAQAVTLAPRQTAAVTFVLSPAAFAPR